MTTNPTTTNRFEQVDEAPDDAMTLTLRRDGEKMYGVVTCPASATGGRLPKNFTSDEMPLKDAIRSAIRLANEMTVALVVADPDGLWQADWGTLYRDADEPPASPN
ncbi:hypothetical protein [Methylobacterium trifolii]|uniref:Uncharacterized protein n=1 Tax=Methylobacterium trifolii TaxID=1003092 RepID=A0ABQ4U2L2_9HYPH|nr:hypothetical protein [Methylobacterium trifolii]GJE61218.1 hypothetical protein MPOCJGCO_3339 [Methylobacterium trifolii]